MHIIGNILRKGLWTNTESLMVTHIILADISKFYWECPYSMQMLPTVYSPYVWLKKYFMWGGGLVKTGNWLAGWKYHENFWELLEILFIFRVFNGKLPFLGLIFTVFRVIFRPLMNIIRVFFGSIQVFFQLVSGVGC